ncbi:hypothetical protein FHG87_004279 [Trinorchestia longiramus]|nr:hypothetical protein FHG87_004279 [Trinorchestia longiramus]
METNKRNKDTLAKGWSHDTTVSSKKETRNGQRGKRKSGNTCSNKNCSNRSCSSSYSSNSSGSSNRIGEINNRCNHIN